MQENTSQEGPWRSIIRSAVDAIVLIDSRGRIEAFNPAAELLQIKRSTLGDRINRCGLAREAEAASGGAGAGSGGLHADVV